MHPPLWHPSIELSAQEQAVVSRIRRAKLFTFLRQVRHELLEDEFQQELHKIFRDSTKGHPPVPPAQLALATILQAYTGASDDEVIEAMVMDRRWQLVLDCLDCQEPPLSKPTLIRFRNALIKHRLDRRLIERTVYLAEHPLWIWLPTITRSLRFKSLVGSLRELRILITYWDTPCVRLDSVIARPSGAGADDSSD